MVLFQSKEPSLDFFHGLFLKVKKLPNDSIFRVYFLILPIFSSFLVNFSCFYKNPISVLKILFWSIFWSILGVRTLPWSFPRSISVVRTLPRSFVGSFSKCPNIDPTIPSSVYTAWCKHSNVSVFSCRFHWLGTVSSLLCCRKENYVRNTESTMGLVYCYLRDYIAFIMVEQIDSYVGN